MALKNIGLWSWRLSRLPLLLYALILVLLYFFQEKLLFHPSDPLPAGHTFRIQLPFEEVRVSHGGADTYGLFIQAKKPRGLILYFHGNQGGIELWDELASHLAERFNWNVLLTDYPGFGKSGGTIATEEQMHAVASKFYDVAKEKAGAFPLVLFGRSMGSGFATKLAAEKGAAGLVLESPYFSMESLAGGMYPFLPLAVLRYRLRSDLWMPKVSAPVLILHGDRDELIPHASGLALSKLVQNGRFVTIEGGGHNDLGGSEFYWAELAAFLSRCCHN